MKKSSLPLTSFLFFLLTIVLFSPASRAATYTVADLPSGGTLTITEDSTFLIGQGQTFYGGVNINVDGNYEVYFLNQGSLGGTISFQNSNSAEFNFTNEGSITGNFNIYNVESEFNLLNKGSLNGNYALDNSGDGIVSLVNSGVMGGNLASNTYGANTNITNDGSLSGNMYIKDQLDVTNFSNMGIISGANIALVANGDMGLINFNNSGLVTDSTSSFDSNYGGHIVFQNILGSADFKLLQIAATGFSHGVESSVDVLYGDLDADTLKVYGETQVASFLTEGTERTFFGVSSGRVIFDYVSEDPSPIPEPATMLLLGLGLAGLAGMGRKMP